MAVKKLENKDYEAIGRREVLNDLLHMVKEKAVGLGTSHSDAYKVKVLKELK